MTTMQEFENTKQMFEVVDHDNFVVETNLTWNEAEEVVKALEHHIIDPTMGRIVVAGTGLL